MIKKLVANAMAPAAMNTAQKSTGYICGAIFNQPKLPKKMMGTVK